MIPNRIVFLGGSNVYGMGDPTGAGFVGRFRAWYEPRDPSNRVFNLGIDGNTTNDMLSQCAEETSRRDPDLIVIYPGMNDARRTGGGNAPTFNTLAQLAYFLMDCRSY